MGIPPLRGAQTGMGCQNTGSAKVLAVGMEYSGMTRKMWKEDYQKAHRCLGPQGPARVCGYSTMVQAAPRNLQGVWLGAFTLQPQAAYSAPPC